MKLNINEIRAEAKRLDMEIGRANGRYSIGKTGEYFVDDNHFTTLHEVRAFLAGYEERIMDVYRKEKEHNDAKV